MADGVVDVHHAILLTGRKVVTTRADFVFHVFAKRNDIAIRHDAYFVGFGDAAIFIFVGITGFGAGGHIVDLRRCGLEAVGFETEEIAFCLERVEQRIERCGCMVGSPPVMMILRAV